MIEICDKWFWVEKSNIAELYPIFDSFVRELQILTTIEYIYYSNSMVRILKHTNKLFLYIF